MANKLVKAISRGTYKTVKTGAQNVGRRALKGVKPPSIYKLGLGIGPTLRNIAAEYKKGDAAQPSATSAAAPSTPQASAQTLKDNIAGVQDLRAGLSSLASILTDIKNISYAQLQLTKAQMRSMDGGRTKFLKEEELLESKAGLTGLAGPGTGEAGGKGAGSTGSFLKDFIANNPVIAAGLGAAITAGIMAILPDVRKKIFGGDGEGPGLLFKGLQPIAQPTDTFGGQSILTQGQNFTAALGALRAGQYTLQQQRALLGAQPAARMAAATAPTIAPLATSAGTVLPGSSGLILTGREGAEIAQEAAAARNAKAAADAAKGVTDAAKAAAPGMKMLGSIGKKLGVVGTAMGAADTYQRAEKGDTVGALLSGIGTAAGAIALFAASAPVALTAAVVAGGAALGTYAYDTYRSRSRDEEPGKGEVVPTEGPAGTEKLEDKAIKKVIFAEPGKTSVEYEDGTVAVRTGPRSLRNNNPGNLEASPAVQQYPGYVGSDGRFAVFKTLKDGEKALERLLGGESYRNRTVAEAMNRYAPPGENNTAAYIGRMQKAGLDPNKRLSDLTADERRRMMATITAVESGGKTVASVNTPSAPPSAQTSTSAFVDLQRVGASNDQIAKLNQAMTTVMESKGIKDLQSVMLAAQAGAMAVPQAKANEPQVSPAVAKPSTPPQPRTSPTKERVAMQGLSQDITNRALGFGNFA